MSFPRFLEQIPRVRPDRPGGTVSKLRRVGAGPVATSAGLAAGEVLLVRLNFGEKAAEKQQQMEVGEKNGKMGVLGSSRSSITSLNFFGS